MKNLLFSLFLLFFLNTAFAQCVNNKTAVVNSGFCTSPDSATLSATHTSGDCPFKWYDAQTGGSEIATGCSFTTPSLTSSTSYWVEDTSQVACNRLEVIAANNCIEHCGDGIDNDGDGLTDEACAAFTCDNTLYQIVESVLNTVDVSNGTLVMTPIVDFSTTNMELNGLAYNPIDNFLYAVDGNNGDLVRIDNMGNYELLGAVTGDGIGFVGGDFDRNGNYYSIDVSPPYPLYRINTITMTSTLISNINLNNVLADFSFNPMDGFIYGISDRRLTRIDPATGAVTFIGSGRLPQSTAGGTYFDPNGRLLVYFNDPGLLYQIDLTTGAGTRLNTGPTVKINDGATCPYVVRLYKQVDPVVANPGDTITYTFTLKNETGFSVAGTELSDVINYGGTIIDLPANPFGGTIITGGVGSSNVRVNDIDIAVGSMTFDMKVQLPLAVCDNDSVANQALLSRLPVALGRNVFSDDSLTVAELQDSTKHIILAQTIIFRDSTFFEDAGNVSITLPLAGNVTVPSTVTITRTGGTAATPSDYTTTIGVINIPIGVYNGSSATAITIPLQIVNDILTEGDETIQWSISGGTGVFQNIAQCNLSATITIIDDDCPPQTLSVCPNDTLTATFNYNNPDAVNWYDDLGGTLLAANTQTLQTILPTLPDTIYAQGIWGGANNITYTHTTGNYGSGWTEVIKQDIGFDATRTFYLESFSIDVHTGLSGSCQDNGGTSGTYTFDLFQNGAATGTSYTFTSTCTASGNLEIVPVNWLIPQGTGYEIRASSLNAFNVYMNWSPGNTWPKNTSLNGTQVISVTGPTQPASSGAFFDWIIKEVSSHCYAPYIVNQSASLNPVVTAPANACTGDTLTVYTSDPGTQVVWTVTNDTSNSVSGINDTLLTVVAGTQDITITLSFPNTCIRDTTFSIGINTVIIPNVSDTTYCLNTTAAQLAATATVGNTLLWYASSTGGTGNTTAPTPLTNTAGNFNFYVSETSPSGCESPRDTITVTVTNPPLAPVGVDTSYCIGDVASNLSATALSGNTLLWYTAATGGTGSATPITPTTNAANTSTYYVSQTANGCEGPRTPIDVIVNSLPIPVITNPVLAICPQLSQVYDAEIHTGSSYNWSTLSGSVQSAVEQNAAQNYDVTFIDTDVQIQLKETDGNGCSDSTNITVVMQAAPLPNITGPNPICISDTGRYEVSNRGGTYAWTINNGAGTSNTLNTNNEVIDLEMAAVGNIELIMTEIFNGCTMTDTLDVTIVPLPVLTFVLPANICEEDPALDLIKTVTPKTGTFSGLGVTGTTFDPGTPGLNLNAQNTITYDYTDGNNCKNDIPDSIEVVENPNVNVTIDDPNICVGETTQLSVVNPNPAYNYTWSPTSETSTTITTGSRGDYNVFVNFNGCFVTSNTVSLNTHSVAVDAGGPYFVKETECVYVSPNYTGSPTSYVWTDLSSGGVIGGAASENICIGVGGADTMHYTIDVENNFGCTANDNFEIIVRRAIQVPEIITPNNDGLNDLWIIRNIGGYPKSTVKVYNRWGNIVFEKIGYLNDWDGMRNGQPLPVATYYYIIELNVEGEEKPYTGSLTIMK